MGKVAIQPLNVIERREFGRLCKIVDDGIATFLEVGNAMLAMREGDMARETHKTFESFAKERWGFEKSHTYRLINSAEVVKQIAKSSPIGDKTELPKNEAQARPLAQLPPEEQADAWKDALDKAKEEGVPVTAAVVEEVVKQHLEAAEPYEEPEEEEEHEEEVEPTTEEAMAESNRRLEALARQVTDLHKQALALEEPHLDEERLNTLLAQLKSAAGTIRAAKGAGTCTYCNGDGCKHCHKSGWLTKIELESAK